MHPNRRTWRIRGIPRDVDREWLCRALRYHSDLRWPGGDELDDFEKGGNDVMIHTLAPDLRIEYQVATVRFQNLPSQLNTLGARDELTIRINLDPESSRVSEECGSASEVLIDEHFDGITPIFSPVTDEKHEIDVLAISGLGSHPFGSFVNKKDGNMWLTTNLPRDIPAARVMIYGYESKLEDSRSHVELDDLAGPVHTAISEISQSKKRPLLLIGHSLGGLLVKEALIRIAEPGFENGGTDLLDRITGILLFGTPNDGLDIESLVAMVNDQPNRSLLESLNSKSSQVLRRQKQQFSNVLARTKLRLYCFYETEESRTPIWTEESRTAIETEESRTAIEDSVTGRWKMDGPHRFLVSQPSATSCLPAGAHRDQSVPIRRNHSDLVKFSSHDAEYAQVARILKQIRHSAKRPAADMLSYPVEKRPRLSSHETETAPSKAVDSPPIRNPVLDNEMRSIKEELIGQLYFSKIDERLTHLAPAQGTTCRWFLTGSKYQSWQDVAQNPEHGGFIWIKGNPGTGKSTLMKYLFETTKVSSQNDPSRITLSFFFLARGTDEEKTTTGLYRSLLHQLFGIASDLKDSLAWMTLDGAKTIQRNGWSEEALKQTLKYAVPKLGTRSLTMFVDALDECDADKADDMVSFFEELCDCAAEARAQLQICFSSRYYPTVVINKGVEVNLEDENGHAEDIRKYVKSKLKLTSKSKQAEVLRSEILEKSSRIFLWVVLVLDILNKEKTSPIQKLRDRLKEIPPGLDDLFRMILERDGHNLEQLKLCLNWILFASRALKPQELYFAIQLGSDKECSGFWDQTDLDLDDMKTFVRSSSKGLAEVTRNKASEVQFIHESVRDFLLGKYRNQWSGTSENLKGHGHQVLRDCCLAQLKASISQQIEIPDPLPRPRDPLATQLRDAISLEFPFLKYSVDNLFYHSNLAQRNGIEQGQFLSDFSLQRWISLNNLLEQFEVRRYTNSVSLLYILGEKDVADLIRIHSRRKFCFQVENERCGAPILAALASNSREAVRTFLLAQAENEPPTSPLHGLCDQYEQQRKNQSRFSRDYTYKKRHAGQVLYDLIDKDEETVALVFLLRPQENGEPSTLSGDPDITLLSLAATQGQAAMFRLLFRGCSLVEQTKQWLDLLLRQAAAGGSEAIVNLLLDRGADVQLSDRENLPPLWIAIFHGHVAVAKLLLDKGVDVDSKNDDGETLLSWAARMRLITGFEFLLGKGADIESRDKIGRTPLSWAAGESSINVDIPKMLLKQGADIDSRDRNGRTPLSWAARHWRAMEAVHLLLEKGAHIESKDKDGRTPLSWAAASPLAAETVRLLLEKGANIESKDKDGRTPLSLAAENYPAAEIVHLLLEKGANIESKDNDGRTPLSWAAGNPTIMDAETVRLLLEKGANITSKDNDGRTPLSSALSRKHSGDYDADVDVVIMLLQEAEGRLQM